MEPEQVTWQGRPSQVLNLGWFLACVFVVPIPIALWKWLTIRCTNYELTTERFKVATGVFGRRLEELELYRVKDSVVDQPFALRLFGLANVVLRTSDRSSPVVMIHAIRDARDVRENIRAAVEKRRAERGVRELDVD